MLEAHLIMSDLVQIVRNLILCRVNQTNKALTNVSKLISGIFQIVPFQRSSHVSGSSGSVSPSGLPSRALRTARFPVVENVLQ